MLLERVLARLAEEYRAQDKERQFEAMRPYLTGDGSAGYREVAASLDTTEGALKLAVHRLRHRFRDALLDEIADTVSSPEEIDSELQHLFTSLHA